MKIRSIRWRLSLSYAAIALLATLLLGVILVLILFNFYSRQEIDYLSGNADSIGVLLAHPLQGELPEDALHSLVENMAFISNTRVRLLDEDGSQIIDSGPPEDRTMIAFEGIPMDGQATFGDDPAISIYVSDPVDFQYIGEGVPPGDLVIIDEAPIFIEAIDAGPIGGWAIAAPAGDLTAPGELEWNGARSTQVVERPYYGPDGDLLGYVELSNGPAYGREIIRSVILGWSIAGGAAVILAAAAGWLLSRRFSAPLTALAEVTSKMTDGNLSVRADVQQQDEFGRLAQSFNHMAESVESKVDTMRRFVADAAHELYTPLSALRGSLELVEIDGSKARQSKHIRQAQDQVTRMDALTQGLLDLSRLEIENTYTQFSEIDLGTLLSSLCEPYASRAEQAGIDFVLRVDEALPAVWGDPSQLSTLVSNLLDNAVKFTPHGGRVEVTVLHSKDSVLLTVEDTGIGIPDDDQPKLFSRFHRGRNASTIPGSGLGLAIVKAITDLHMATIETDSDENGTKICIHFPATQ